MKPAPFVPPLTGSAGLWPAAKPGFAALAASSLGNAGSPSDGTDGLLASLLNAFNAGGPLLDAITHAGLAAAAAQAAVDAISLPNLDGAIDAATKGMAAAVTRLGGLLATLQPSPTWTAGVGSAPLPPIVEIGTATSGSGSSGSSLTSQEGSAGAITTGAVSVVSALQGAGVISAALAQSLAIAIPIIGAAIGVALLLIHFLGHGCGEACIDAAKAEQIYEAAADNLFAVYRSGLISLTQAVAGMVHLFSAGTAHLATFGTSQAEKGTMNMQRVISGEIASVQKLPTPKPVPFDASKARLDYVSGPGWYPDSLAAAAQLTDEYLQALQQVKGV